MTARPSESLYLPADAIDAALVRRVLVVVLRHHGDVLLTTPVFSALRVHCPEAQIDALVYSDTVPLIEFNPDLSEIHRIDKAWKREGAWKQAIAEFTLLGHLRARSYDLIVHLTNKRRGAWLTRLLRPRWSVAPKLKNGDRLWRKSFTHQFNNASSGASAGLARRHTVEQNVDALRRLGLPTAIPHRLTLVPGAVGAAAALQFLEEHAVRGDYVLVQPTSRWMFKCWSVENNVAMITALLERGMTVILSCAPDSREEAMIRAIAGALGAPRAGLILANEGSTLQRLAALIGGARLFVGIDSAPMHMAAAMATPTVALFGPSGESNWGPWKGDGTLVARVVTHGGYSCRPCGQDGCGGGKISACLTELPVSAVMSAIDEVLAQSEPLLNA